MMDMQAAPPPPIPPIPPTPVVPPIEVFVGGQGPLIRSGSPSAQYEAFRHQRTELRNQLERLENQREQITEELRQVPSPTGADQRGLEQRLAAVDVRIAATEKQIAEADASVAAAAAIPGAVVERREPRREGPPEEVFVLGMVFMFVVLLPLVIAYSRRIWRRSAAAVAALPQEIYDRFARVDQSLDAIAVEVERIGEGQRYLTRLHADQQRSLGAGQAERVEAKQRDAERQR